MIGDSEGPATTSVNSNEIGDDTDRTVHPAIPQYPTDHGHWPIAFGPISPERNRYRPIGYSTVHRIPENMENKMSNTTFRMVKLVGESPDGIEAAVLQALGTSAEKVQGQTWTQVEDIRANINEQGGVDRWQVTVEVAFQVD